MRTFKEIPLSLLIRGDNIREVKGEDVSELMASIAEKGQLQPLVVVPAGGGRYRVIFGFRRFLAMELLDYQYAMCEIRSDIPREEEPILQLVENTQRQEMDAEELVKVFNRLKIKGMTNQEIAKKLGRTDGWVVHQYITARYRDEQRRKGLAEEEVKKISVSQAIKANTLKNRSETSFQVETSGSFSLRVVCRNKSVMEKVRSSLNGLLGSMERAKGKVAS